MHCREILFTPRCSPRPGSVPGLSTFLYDVRLWSYGASKLPNFRILAYFLHTKRLKRTFRWPAYNPGVTSQNDSDFSVIVEGPKECLPEAEFSCDFWQGSWGPPKLAQIFAYSKWLYQYRMLLHSVLDLDQRCLKTHSFKDECTFTPNIFAPTPKIPAEPHFGYFFNAKPIIERALRSHTLMELRSWNFTAT